MKKLFVILFICFCYVNLFSQQKQNYILHQNIFTHQYYFPVDYNPYKIYGSYFGLDNYMSNVESVLYFSLKKYLYVGELFVINKIHQNSNEIIHQFMNNECPFFVLDKIEQYDSLGFLRKDYRIGVDKQINDSCVVIKDFFIYNEEEYNFEKSKYYHISDGTIIDSCVIDSLRNPIQYVNKGKTFYYKYDNNLLTEIVVDFGNETDLSYNVYHSITDNDSIVEAISTYNDTLFRFVFEKMYVPLSHRKNKNIKYEYFIKHIFANNISNERIVNSHFAYNKGYGIHNYLINYYKTVNRTIYAETDYDENRIVCATFSRHPETPIMYTYIKVTDNIYYILGQNEFYYIKYRNEDNKDVDKLLYNLRN